MYTEAETQNKILHLIELLSRQLLGNCPTITNQLILKNLFGWLLQAKQEIFLSATAKLNHGANIGKSDFIFRSSHRRYSLKKGVLKNFANFTRKHLCWRLFLITLQAWGPTALLKRDSNTGVFLSKSQNLFEQLFWRTYAEDCFYVLINLIFWYHFNNFNKNWGWRTGFFVLWQNFTSI